MSYRRNHDGESTTVEDSTAGATGDHDLEQDGWLNGEIAQAKAAWKWMERLRKLVDELNAIPGVTATMTVHIGPEE